MATIVLAGGASRRAGSVNKLLASYRGKPLVRHAVETVAAAPLFVRICVTGHDARRVGRSIEETGIQIVYNKDHTQGVSSSIITGLRALPAETDGVLIVLGDMPEVTVDILNSLIAAFSDNAGRSICVPTYRGRRGNPVLWPQTRFSDILALEGDMGARNLLRIHAAEVVEVPVDSDGILHDVDLPDEIAAEGKPS
ncbi:MAG: nucleotidyltransferase family protein [Gammaproteobacteria bacterium]|nr:nucleotidyltransferase family protein [Gammaproteobacteria bacterium]